ncbi:LysR family transcriptional regulator [Kribbella sp. NPDC023855]|uniref:LysR substrate-binding domain-containing protein n=1 Tax=Kribbella sp. NPDC023855 TaxID=3154698 RepID=UPI00340297A3
MDLEAVRTFVAAATAGKFQDAADDLRISQQAVSKRIAALERHLDTTLFTRTARGAQLTLDGQTFLPHAQALLEAAQRALASVRPGSRPLRVDVIAGFLAPAGLLRDFHRAHPDVDLDIATLPDGAAAIAAVREGKVDAAFRALRGPLGTDLIATRVFDEPLQLLTGPAHPLAGADTLTLAELEGREIWMPGNLAGTEWSAYYDELAAAFGFSIDTTGPNFGLDVMLDGLAEDPTRATFVGEQTRFRWPESYRLRRIDFRDPTPVYPHSLIRRADNRHPALAALGDHFAVPVATTSVWSGRGDQAGDQGA